MSAHKVLPPVQLPSNVSGMEAIEVLQRKLQKSDEETMNLAQQLAKMGFSDARQRGNVAQQQSSSSASSKSAAGPEESSSIRPFSPNIPDPKVLHKNYEALVSRVCKAESSIQSLKLNLLRAQAERNLGEKACRATNEKLHAATDAYEKELKRLNRELAQEKQDCRLAHEAKQQVSSEFKKLQDTIEEVYRSKAEIEGQYEVTKSSNMKLTRRTEELKDELARESKLRASLEESHNTLLARVKEMEQVVEEERNDVKTLTGACNRFKQETLVVTEDRAREAHLRTQLEEDYNRLAKERESLMSEMKTLRGDKDLLMKEVDKMQSQYQRLNQHLDQVQKLTQERQSSHEQLEIENKQLYERIKTAAGHNAEIVTDYEARLDELKSDLILTKKEAEKNAHLQEQLLIQNTEKTCAIQECSNLNEKMADLSKQLENKERELVIMSSTHQREITQLAERVRLLEDDKSKAVKDKDVLLDEINQAVDSMTEEKARLETEKEETRLEILGLQQANNHLESEHRRLLDKLAQVEDKQSSKQQIQSQLAELTASKQKLAYDNGRLETMVDQLQRELEGQSYSKSQFTTLQKQNQVLQNKCSQLQSDLTSSRLSIQRLEGQLKQASVAGERKETDFDMAIQSRDEALDQAKTLRGKMKMIDEEYLVKAKNLQESLAESRSDNQRLASTLEGIMSTHSSLQNTVESLQAELGKKDSCLATLQRDKKELQTHSKELQDDLENLNTKLAAVTDMEVKELKPLRQALSQCKSDNSKMALTMESLLQSNSSLQNSVRNMKDKLEQKSHIVDRLTKAKAQDKEMFEDQLAIAKTNFQTDREKIRKEHEKTQSKLHKEINKVQKQLEESVSKNGDLSRTNAELRSKHTEQEYQLKEQKEKVTGLRNQVSHLTRIRHKHEHTIDSLQTVSDSLVELERTKDEYTRKNKEQARTIQSFIKQIEGLQEEIGELARLQMEASEQLKQQTDGLSVDQQQRKYKAAKEREIELESQRKKTENKLHEVHEESHNLSSTVEDTHKWFQAKFDSLQDELSKSRIVMSSLGQNQQEKLEEERKKSRDIASRAREMIKSSHETVSKLTDYAEASQKIKQHELTDLRLQLEEERKKARKMEEKLQSVQESSLRHTEKLAREVQFLRSQDSLSEGNTSLNYSDLSL